MTPRPLRVLCVEDDPLQQKLLGHALRGVKEFACEVDFETAEDGGVAAFRSGNFDFVMTDYQLAGGSGLGLVKRIRELDPVVPIIALSASAAADIAAEMVISGADDYLDKTCLDTKTLSRSLRISLLRADGIRKRLPSAPAMRTPADEVAALLGWLGPGGIAALPALLNRCSEAIRTAGLSADAVPELFETPVMACSAAAGVTHDTAREALRPFVLELKERLSET